MGRIRDVEPVKLFCGIIAVDEENVHTAESTLEECFGGIDIRSAIMPFDLTEYYRQEMGSNLLRRFVSFKKNIDPSGLSGVKTATNEIECRNRFSGNAGRGRMINLDPGYVTPAKVVLATTKDFSHRIYIGQGIYAEVTLQCGKKGFTANEWTYPDFRSGNYDQFFRQIRECLMKQRKSCGDGTC